MAYASYNRGYKSGVFSIFAPTSPALKPETLDAFEVGLKSEFFDHILRLDAAAYHYNYRQLQISQFVPPASTALFNAAAAKINGLDLAAEFAPRISTGNLKLTAALAIIDAKFISFPDGPVSAPNPPDVGGETVMSGNLAGNYMQDAPKLTLNLALDYTVAVGPGELGFSGNFYHNNGFFFSPDNRLQQGPYDLVNATISYAFGAQRQYGVRLWARNLTNKLYYVFETEQSFGSYGVAGLPRLFGVGVNVNF